MTNFQTNGSDRKSVLLVDDNKTHQYSLGKHLTASGFKVYHAQTGAETLALARQHLPDAILLDINLPDMSGFDVCKNLKSQSGTAKIPVIFHSATHDTQSARMNAYDLGAVSFLSYPISIEHLVSVLRGSLVQSRAQYSKE